MFGTLFEREKRLYDPRMACYICGKQFEVDGSHVCPITKPMNLEEEILSLKLRVKELENKHVRF